MYFNTFCSQLHCIVLTLQLQFDTIDHAVLTIALYLPNVAVFGVVVAGHRLQVAWHRFLASTPGEAMFFGFSPPCAEICTICLIWALIGPVQLLLL